VALPVNVAWARRGSPARSLRRRAAGLPNGGRGGAPRARFEDAGEGDVDKFAPRKVTVSPQSWVSGGLGGVSLLGGDGMTAQDVYGQPPPAEWLPPASFRRH